MGCGPEGTPATGGHEWGSFRGEEAQLEGCGGLPVIREGRSRPQGAPVSHTIRWAGSQELGDVKC